MSHLPLRLPPGADLRRSLEGRASGAGLSAFVVAGIGSLSDVALRLAAEQRTTQREGPYEIISLSGTLSANGAHLHMSVANREGQVVGGHVCYGNIIRTTAEILLVVVEGWELSRALDPTTGFQELQVAKYSRRLAAKASSVNLEYLPVENECPPFEAWKSMWLDYLGKQAEALDQKQHRLTYARLISPDFNLFGIVARGAEPVGFAHFYFHPSTFHAREDCCLQDLYVHPGARGSGVGRALVEQVARVARARDAPVLHWKTRESNLAARSMYSRFAQRSEFVSFRLPL